MSKNRSGRSGGTSQKNQGGGRSGPRPGPASPRPAQQSPSGSASRGGPATPTPASHWVAALTWQAITPLHPGTSQVSASDIDLPVAREGGTNLPMVPASSIKGVFRDGVGLEPDADKEDSAVKKARRLYGHADDNKTGAVGEAIASAGDLTFTDARLLALAVPSFWGTFALVTCPLVLERLNRDRELLGLTGLGKIPTPARSNGNRLEAYVADGSVLHEPGQGQKLTFLQDLDFAIRVHDFLDGLPQRIPSPINYANRADSINKRLLLVHDDVFAHLCRTSLEVSAHVRLEPQTKTVQNGGLWFEETIPAESLLSSFVFGSDPAGKAAVKAEKLRRLGGKSTVGRGLLQLHTEIKEVTR